MKSKLSVLSAMLTMLVALGLSGCSQETKAPDAGGVPKESGAEIAPEQTYQIFWNFDRSETTGDTVRRKPAEDGTYSVQMFSEGEIITFSAPDRDTVDLIDRYYLVGLTVDEQNVITEVIAPDRIGEQLICDEFYVCGLEDNTVNTNSSFRFDGMEASFLLSEQTGIYDMTGVSGPIGTVTVLQEDDKIIAYGSDGIAQAVFVFGRQGVNSRIDRYCDQCKQEVKWASWYHESSLPVTSGHYYLATDVMLAGQVNIPESETICLDLNGHTVTGAENARIYSMHYDDITLSVFDYSADKTGGLVGWGDRCAQGVCVWVRFGTFNLYGGTLDGSGAISNVNGVTVAVPKNSVFNMYGGTVIGGKTTYAVNTTTGVVTNSMGGSVSVAGTFDMYGGTIRDGYATCYENRNGTYSQGYGGNVLVAGGKFTLHGGTIENGKAEGGGGNVYVTTKGAFTMKGGSLTYGLALKKGKNGGNLVVGKDCTFTMESGTIFGGRSFNYGGNIHVIGKMEMIGGSIYGGEIVDVNTGTFKKEHTAKNLFLVDCDFSMYGGWIGGSVAVTDSKADDGVHPRIYLDDLARITGAAEGTNNLLINTSNDGATVNVGQLRGRAQIGISATGKFTEVTDEKNKDYFVCDNPEGAVTYVDGCLFIGRLRCLCGYEEHRGQCDGQQIPWTAWTSDNNLPTEDGYYYLTSDVTCYMQSIAANAHVYLDLNGKTVTRPSAGRIYSTFNSGAHLTITDSSTGKTGKIVANGASSGQGNVVWVRYGSFTMYGGTLDASKVTSTMSGTAVAVDKGTTFTMYGGTVIGGHSVLGTSGGFGCSGSIHVAGTYILEDGTVTGGKSENHGGNIYITGSGIMDMNGGTVSGGMAMGSGKSGGNVYVEGTGRLTIADGEIIDGSCRNIGGNIFVSGEMEMKGGTVSGGQRCAIAEDGTVTKTNFASGNINVVNGKLTMSGGYIDGYVAITSTSAPGAVMTLTGDAKIGTTGNYLTLVGGTVLNIPGQLDANALVYIDAQGIISGETAKENTACFKTKSGEEVSWLDGVLVIGTNVVVPEEIRHCVCGASNGKHIVNCPQTQVIWTAWDNGTALPAATGYYYLTKDITLTKVCSIPANAKIVLDLNGHTVQSKPGSPIGRLIFLNAAGAELTLTDTSAAQTGKLTQSGSFTSWTD